jgi:hypothetical protein
MGVPADSGASAIQVARGITQQQLTAAIIEEVERIGFMPTGRIGDATRWGVRAGVSAATSNFFGNSSRMAEVYRAKAAQGVWLEIYGGMIPTKDGEEAAVYLNLRIE